MYRLLMATSWSTLWYCTQFDFTKTDQTTAFHTKLMSVCVGHSHHISYLVYGLTFTWVLSSLQL